MSKPATLEEALEEIDRLNGERLLLRHLLRKVEEGKPDARAFARAYFYPEQAGKEVAEVMRFMRMITSIAATVEPADLSDEELAQINREVEEYEQTEEWEATKP